jgi:predicted esterase
MKLRQLIITGLVLFFLPQLTLAQKPGTITDIVPCKKSPNQTYALYLPKSYSESKSFGLIIFFDPGAEGKFPVNEYQSIAEKYSLILAGSNNSKNGSVDASTRAGNAVLEDVLARYSIDKKFIITSGFSGGARAATGMASNDRTITGVIACGAAFNKPDAITIQRQIPYAEVIGQIEMNYQEALQANDYLKSIHNPAFLTFFYAYHEWPPVDAYEEAVAWHQLRVNNNADLEREVVAKTLKKAQVKIDSGYMADASHILKQHLGLKPIDSMFAIVQKDKRTRPLIKQAEKMDLVERQLQQQYLFAYSQHIAYAAPDSAYHPKYWRNFRKECDKMVASGDRTRKLAGLRLIDAGWHRCSENYWIFMGEQQYRQASMSAKIFTLIWPTNAWPCYLAAKAFALQKRKSETFEYLRQAMERGVTYKQRIATDPDFAEYAKTEEFQQIFK